jgi:hypothetical protein
MSNEKPTVYNEGFGVDRLNALLDQLTSKRFFTAALAIQTIRAALDLHGITLPVVPAEHPDQRKVNWNGSRGNWEGEEYEYLWHLDNNDTPNSDQGDRDNKLNLYIVINKDEDGVYDVYAQILYDDEVETITSMDNLTDKDYEELVGDEAGETAWLKNTRNIGTFKGDR